MTGETEIITTDGNYGRLYGKPIKTGNCQGEGVDRTNIVVRLKHDYVGFETSLNRDREVRSP